MNYVVSFLISVGAKVTSYYLCKWLDRLSGQHQHKENQAVS